MISDPELDIQEELHLKEILLDILLTNSMRSGRFNPTTSTAGFPTILSITMAMAPTIPSTDST